MPVLGLPYQLSGFERAVGVIKADYTDFVVEEIPLYDPSGAGSHTFFQIEKAGLGTVQATADLAEALGVRRVEIGYAGLKDARAVTRQWLSVEHVDPNRVLALSIPRITILEATRHTNKLKLGHLRGNRFTIRVRDTAIDRLAEFQDALDELTRRGVPNYFGTQRFGDRGDNPRIGAALLRNEFDAALDIVLGQPGSEDHGKVRHARELYEHGHYEQAIRNWPGMYRDERRALRTLLRTGKKKRALLAIDKNTRRFYISAYQSELFNRVLAARLETGIDRLLDGDLAWRHPTGAVFLVESAATEQARADAFEISPSGPLFGARMTEPTGTPARIEADILAAAGVSREALADHRLRIKGARRPLRYRPEAARVKLGADERGAYLEVSFALPRGCYATTLLRELFDENTVTIATPVRAPQKRSRRT